MYQPKKLLTPLQIYDIKNALNDVTYTFSTGDILYRRYRGNLGIFGEDREENGRYDEYRFKAILQFADANTDKVQLQETGSRNREELKITINFRDLQALGLVRIDPETQNKIADFNPTVDNFEYEGDTYIIDFLQHDGYFDSEPVLVIVEGRIKERERFEYP